MVRFSFLTGAVFTKLLMLAASEGTFESLGTTFVITRDPDDRKRVSVDGSGTYYFGGDPPLNDENIEMNGDNIADGKFRVMSSRDSSEIITFNCELYYKAQVHTDYEGRGVITMTFEDKDGCPFSEKESWHDKEELYVNDMVAVSTLPWIKFVNVTDENGQPLLTKKGFEIVKSYSFDESGVDERAFLDFTFHRHYATGTYYYEELEYEFCVEKPEVPATVRSDFLGLAMEWDDVIDYLSIDGKEINPYLLNFFDTVNKGHINVNSNSGMYVFLEESGLDSDFYRSTGVSLEDLDFLEKFATDTQQSLVLGLPMLIENDSEYALTLLNDGILKRISPSNILALEYGNEPDHWTRSKKGFRDPETFNYPQFKQEFLNLDVKILEAWPEDVVGSLEIQGPSLAGCNTFPGKDCWNKYLEDFAEDTRAKYIAVHRYGNSGCSPYTTAETLLSDPDPNLNYYDFIEELRVNFKEKGLNKEVIWGEGNALSCGGIDGVSNTFAAPLWLVDNLLEHAIRGVARAHIHADLYHNYSPFTQGPNGILKPHAMVYGMLQFSDLIDEGDEVEVYRVNLCSGDKDRSIKGYALESEKNGNTRVIIIAKEWRTSNEFEVKVNVPEKAGTSAKLTRMTSPEYYDTVGMKVAGQYYGENGKLRGKYTSQTVSREEGEPFLVRMNPTSVFVLEYKTEQ